MNEDYDYTHTRYNIKLSLSVKLIMPNIKQISIDFATPKWELDLVYVFKD
jgi:hypothetical protein